MERLMPNIETEVGVAHIIDSNALIQKLDLSEHEGNKRFIAGYANIANIRDSQGDIVTLDALKNAWEKWKSTPEFCILSLLHSNIPLAKVVFESVTDNKNKLHQSGVDERGLYIVAQVRDDVTIADDIWEKIQRGEFRGYSIGGRNLNPQPPECKAGVCTSEITDFELYEVGIVDQPANKVSLFNVLKRDTLAKLAEVTKSIKEMALQKGIIRISKTPCSEAKHYHVLLDISKDNPLYKQLSQIFEGDDFVIIDEKKEGEEYVSLFDLALLRPRLVITEEERHGGVNPPPLQDAPKNQGETPLSEKIEEVIEEKTEDSKESETSETPEPVEEKQEEEVVEEVIAPLTMETIAADLAQLRQLVEDIGKKVGYEPETEKAEEEEEATSVDELVEKIQKSIEGEVPEKVEEAPPEVKVEDTPESVAEKAEEKPVEEKAVAEKIVEVKEEPKIETRGVSSQTPASPRGPDLASLQDVSWKEIHREMKRKIG